MPVRPDKAPATVSQQFAEVELGENIMRPENPIVRCRIVYMGNNRNRSLALRGQILQQNIQTGFDDEGKPVMEILKSAVDEGMQNYDFSSHDAVGKIILERMMPQDAGPELAGKPFAYCEHIQHIREFYLMKTHDGQPEFKVLANRADQPIIQDYVRRFMRSQAGQEQQFAEVAGAKR